MYQLYYYPGNANLAPHMLLEEIGVSFELLLVDRAAAAHKQPAYLRLNPSGRIPVLVDGDLVLFETAAICLHLADCHPAAALVPAVGSIARAQCYKWLMYLTNTLQAELLCYFYPERLADDEAAVSQVCLHAEKRIEAMIDLLENTLADGRSWLLGIEYSILDPYLFMLARWTRNMHRPAKALPHFAAYLARVHARPAVQRALAREGLGEPVY
ncbi:Glutathione S-transferase GST-4.5 [Andreprevotia sp. IGB-42]|uniref:glutathione S-transferase family protein n=1 Tax=Andreprevotia sp. IGB-42 TaxID=2497473 RepID=UPI00135CE75B|nr:glutathione S-transferase N-terminal domain-containing protein [Andreprevotia sp. IGB-42]KAF0814432.1 Glutathione S-transferase GST-4.5 [Andreprevotia sp. IGB-42]